jgi:hypothetical protein
MLVTSIVAIKVQAPREVKSIFDRSRASFVVIFSAIFQI